MGQWIRRHALDGASEACERWRPGGGRGSYSSFFLTNYHFGKRKNRLDITIKHPNARYIFGRK